MVNIPKARRTYCAKCNKHKSLKLLNIKSHRSQSLPRAEDVTIVSNKVLVDRPNLSFAKRQRLQRSWYLDWNVARARRGHNALSKEQNISSWAEIRRGKVK